MPNTLLEKMLWNFKLVPWEHLLIIELLVVQPVYV